MNNEQIAAHLREHASKLDLAGGNLFRARSYRGAAFAIARLLEPLRDIFERSGRAGLESIPGIGVSMAYTIEKLLTSGEFRVLREPDVPQRMLLTIPGIGPRLAETLRDRLGITSLEGLRDAIRNGKLATHVSKRQEVGMLAVIESRLRHERSPVPPGDEPSVEALLAVDAAFRAAEQAVYLTRHEGWQLRAHPANTALAHRMGMTEDWVSITFLRAETQGQRTIVTETRGKWAGKRVVRGREAESDLVRVYGLKMIEPAA